MFYSQFDNLESPIGLYQDFKREKPISFNEMIDTVFNGNYTIPMKEDGVFWTESLEKLTLDLQKNGKGSEFYNRYKKHLPAISANAYFPGERRISASHQFTGMMAIDIDDISEEEVGRIMEACKKDPNVLWAKRSVSLKGVHIFVRVANLSDENFKTTCAWVFKEYATRLQTDKIDEKCKDASRLIFLNHDPGVYVNREAQALDAQTIVEQEKDFVKPFLEEKAMTKLSNYIDNSNLDSRMVKGQRHNTLLSYVPSLNKAGFDREEVKSELVNRYQASDFDEKEIKEIVDYVYDQNSSDFGTNQKEFKSQSPKVQKSNIEKKNEKEEEVLDSTEPPILEGEDYVPNVMEWKNLLPKIFQSFIHDFDSPQIQVMKVTTAIAVLGQIARNKFRIHRKTTNLNLAVCVWGPPASGKSGVLEAINAWKIHADRVQNETLAENKKYKKELRDWKKCEKINETKIKNGEEPCDCGEEPVETKIKYLTHQLKTTYSGLMKYMKDAQPFGSLLYTTEMDDLNDGNSHRDFNSVSPLIRKITEGEDAETVYKNAGRTVLKDPSAAIIFSGTENQFRNYFKTTGNGEISRYFFIRLNGGAFKTLAEDYEEDNSLLELEKWREGVILGVSKYFERYSFKIEFTLQQLERIDKTFEPYAEESQKMGDPYYEGVIRRFSSLAARMIAIISSFYACEENFVPDDTHNTYGAKEEAMEFVLNLFPYLIMQQKVAFYHLPIQTSKDVYPNAQEHIILYNALPEQFHFGEGLEVCRTTIKKQKTSFREILNSWINGGYMSQPLHGIYKKEKPLVDETTPTASN